MNRPNPFPDLPPIFADCVECDPPQRYPHLAKPFVQGDFIWATDGRIAIKLKADAYLRANHPAHDKPELARVTAESFEAGDTHEIPEIGRKECECCGEMTMLDIPEDGLKVGPFLLGAGYVTILHRHGVKEVSGSPGSPSVAFKVGDVEGILMKKTDRL